MAFYEREQRQSGNHEAGPQASEREKSVNRFSKESREALADRGFVIVELTGQSIKTLREQGKSFTANWHKGHWIEDKPSELIEVAYHPDPEQFILRDSNHTTRLEQEKMVADHSKELGREIPGVEAAIDIAPNYVELAFVDLQNAILEGRRDFLFKKRLVDMIIRTKTDTEDPNAIHIAELHEVFGLSVLSYSKEQRFSSAYAAPLIKPAPKITANKEAQALTRGL